MVSGAIVRLQPIAGIHANRHQGRVRTPFQLVVPLLVSGCAEAPQPTSVPPAGAASTQATESCQGRLLRVTGPEIVRLVSGARMRFAGAEGVCAGSIWPTTNWQWEFRAGGELRYRHHRVGGIGRYAVTGDELCVATGPRRNCYRLYRDPLGRLYLAGATDSLPAMMTIVR